MAAEFQRWTAKGNAEVVVRLMKGEIIIVELCREQDLQQSSIC
jgi:hypothetical protein